MTKKDKGTAVACGLFLLNACIVGPVGYVVTEHARAMRDFKSNVAAKFLVMNKRAGEIEKFAAWAEATAGEQEQDLKEIRQRITRLENAIYAVQNRNPGQSPKNDQTRRGI